MKKIVASVLALMLVMVSVGLTTAEEKEKSKDDKKRDSIDKMAKDTLKELYEEREKSKKFFDSAYGYAVFNNVKVSLMISGGGGEGVAVNKSTNKRTYMKMGTVGLNIGLGAQKYQVVFLFEDKKVFDEFVDKGWQADANANAVAGTKGLNAEAAFQNGIAVYQITEAGLMLQADIAGTKYWKSKKLNKE